MVGAELPRMTKEAERQFRDIYDHLIRISDLIDSYRDLLTSSMTPSRRSPTDSTS